MGLDDISKDMKKKLDENEPTLPQFNKEKAYTLDEIVDEFHRRGFNQPKDWMAGKHGAEVQFVRQSKGKLDPRQHHWRVWQKKNNFKIEAHEDIVSPDFSKFPVVGAMAHAAIDVGVVGAAKKLAGKNLNNTRTMKLKRRRN